MLVLNRAMDITMDVVPTEAVEVPTGVTVEAVVEEVSQIAIKAPNGRDRAQRPDLTHTMRLEETPT